MRAESTSSYSRKRSDGALPRALVCGLPKYFAHAVREMRKPRARTQGCNTGSLLAHWRANCPLSMGSDPTVGHLLFIWMVRLTGWPCTPPIPKSDIYQLPPKCTPGLGKGLLTWNPNPQHLPWSGLAYHLDGKEGRFSGEVVNLALTSPSPTNTGHIFNVGNKY